MKRGSEQTFSKAKMSLSSHFSGPSSLMPSMRSRSLSPLIVSETPPFHSGGEWSAQAGLTDENTMLLESQHHKGSDSCVGVRYITEALIKKLTKQDNLTLVKSLNLSLSKDGGKKFRYIENLDKCVKLEVLNLSYNLIAKIEKVDKLLRLRELNLSYNKISKIEGLENMFNLQKLNLAGNEIQHIPVWLAKKLKSLRVLNLKGNKISSLQDVSKLKPLQDLTSLTLIDNPLATLPHYLQFTIFHLRSLESLEGQPVTTQDRQEAFERFSLEEVERLEKDLEKKMVETDELKNKQTKFLEEIKNQDKLNKSLKEEAMLQKQNCEELESDLNTKNELLKQKTMELTRACQKQYELEQELAFYKIDAKFEPLNYYPSEYAEIDKPPDESPYIGKSRYKRNMFATETYILSDAQAVQIQKMMPGGQLRHEHVPLRAHALLDVQVEDTEKNISAAQIRLSELHHEIETAEQKILQATQEFKQLEEAIQQKKLSEAEKDLLLKQLSSRIQFLNKLRQEALDLEMQMEKQRKETAEKQEDINNLQLAIDSLDFKDPKHSHMKAQKRGKEQQLDIMNKQYTQLESRLNEILSRIAKETEEIKDLEQQLTDGQIAANEALKKDLEGVISGLQEYLGTIKGQATQAQNECRKLQDEKETLLQRLTDVKQERDELEIVAIDAENMRKELAELESALQEQREMNASLQQAQGELSAYEAELETRLKLKDAEASQLKGELEKLTRLTQLEQSVLQTELEKERESLRDALGKAQSSEEKQQENSELRTQLKKLQDDNSLLKQQLKDFQKHLNQVVDGLIHPEEVAARVDELRRKLKLGAGEMRIHSPSDVLGKSLANLQKQFSEILARSQWEKEEAQVRERKLHEEMVLQQETLANGQEEFRQACERALEARVKFDKRQHNARIQQLENEIHYLQENLKSMEEIQGLTDLQLQEADEEKERIMAQLQELEKKKKHEDAKSQEQFLGLDKELKSLKKAVAASDKLAAAELTITKDQLKSLHGTVMRINQERAELNEVSRLEDIMQHLKSNRQEEQWPKASKQHSEKEVEELHHNIDDLLQEKKELEHEVEELHRTIQKHQQRKDFIDGNVENLMTELEIEKSLKRHEDIVDEVACIEKTLLKRRSELREADQLLAEAEHELSCTKEKTKHAVEKFADAERNLLQIESDAEALEKRAQETALNLVKAEQQLRLLQADAEDLEQHKIKQEEILKEINKVVAAKDADFQCLNEKKEKLTKDLQSLQRDIKTAEHNEDHHLQVLKDSETLLQAKRAELETLRSQVTSQQQELAVLDTQLRHRREELLLLQDSLVQAKADLQEALTLGETEVAEKCSHIREVKSLLEELSFQKGELNVHISEQKTQLALIKQEMEKEEENLQIVLQQLSKHKTELKNLAEILQLENSELQGLKLQRDQKVMELEKTQVDLLEEKLELENLQQTIQQQNREIEWQKQLLERDKREIERVRAETQALRSCIECLTKEKEDLQEQCEAWEKKSSQAKRVLATTEESNRTEQSNLGKLEHRVRELQQELEHLSQDKLAMHSDISMVQHQLQDKREAINSLQEELGNTQDHLNQAKQDLLHTTQRQNALLSEQEQLQKDISKWIARFESCQKETETKEQQLQELQNEIRESKLQLEQQEMMFQKLQKETESEEQKLEAGKVTLKQQQEQLEKEVTEQKTKLEQLLTDVSAAEGRLRTLQEEGRCSESLEKLLSQAKQQLSEREQQLIGKSSELLAQQEEADAMRADFSLLRNQFLTERKKAEKQVAGLKEALKFQRSQLEKNLLEQRQENSCMQKEMATIELVAQDNHERARRLMKELNQMQHEYLELKKQMANQKDLERRQMEINDAMRTLKSEVKDEIRTSLKNFNQFLPELPADLTAILERNENLGELESLKENFPFTTNERLFEEKSNFSQIHIMDEHWRGEALRERLRHREDRLKAQLRHCMSKQAEVLIKGKRQTEGTLHSLRRQVDALGELVTSSSVDSTSPPSLSHLDSSLVEDSQIGQSRSSFRVLQGHPSEPHSYHR
uniref:Centriolin n=1 Tax=Cricetulus griseus TaxID=10029 RepID=A0A8C2LHP3_CRIGR